jgi:aminoglycoside 6'-N-acetyltransferase
MESEPAGPRVPPAPLRGRLVVVRPASLADAPLLASWHAVPEVRRFWDDKAFTEEEMEARLRRPHVDPYIVECDGEPVGYLQAWFRDDEGLCGLDLFLLPSARGRSLGPDAARALARYLVEEADRPRVTVDPYLWNERAIRGWRNAGFRAVEEREADERHPHPWLLMEFDPET